MVQTVQVNLRLPYDLARRVERLALKRGISRTRAYTQMIEQALERDPDGKSLDIAPELADHELVAPHVGKW